MPSEDMQYVEGTVEAFHVYARSMEAYVAAATPAIGPEAADIAN